MSAPLVVVAFGLLAVRKLIGNPRQRSLWKRVVRGALTGVVEGEKAVE